MKTLTVFEHRELRLVARVQREARRHAGRAGLGGDDDRAVRRAGTVQRGRRSAAQDRDLVIYLTDMAVRPDYQGKGIGRAMLAEAVRIVREWPADAIRLDVGLCPLPAPGRLR